MKRVITYGTYDLFHEGHLNLLRRAKELGDYLIVGVTTDSFDLERGKLNVCDNLMDRIEAVRATGLADRIVIEEYQGQKIDDIQKYGADIFAIGSDWTGKFDYLREYCEVVYLPRTEGISSTQLRERRAAPMRLGVVGSGSIARRFADEAACVSGVDIEALYNPVDERAALSYNGEAVRRYTGEYGEFLDAVDAVYVASPPVTHYGYVREALLSGKHVLCETPFVLSDAEARELYVLAEERGLTLMVALKTAYCPAFNHLITLLKSGVIGDIVDVTASVTTLLPDDDRRRKAAVGSGSFNENSCFPLLPVLRLLGTDYEDIRFVSRFREGVDEYTRCMMQYPAAVASFQVGLGVKTEGNMVISGSKGYLIVPAPWWKTDYFEVRYENPAENRKFFYPYAGEGLRYEIKEFLMAVRAGKMDCVKLTEGENVAMAAICRMFKEESVPVVKI